MTNEEYYNKKVFPIIIYLVVLIGVLLFSCVIIVSQHNQINQEQQLNQSLTEYNKVLKTENDSIKKRKLVFFNKSGVKDTCWILTVKIKRDGKEYDYKPLTAY